ncbi:MAG: hypothetical protein ACLFN2_08110, partial [Bacteroidales bacterium]
MVKSVLLKKWQDGFYEAMKGLLSVILSGGGYNWAQSPCSLCSQTVRNKKRKHQASLCFLFLFRPLLLTQQGFVPSCRGERIRTSDLVVPNDAR